ncbi:MAG: S-methyl-5-thioribose-1-phosphate isomerase, partial [Jatrophihabitans sp.]
MRTVDWVQGQVEIVDQTLLPGQELRLRISRVDELIEAIRRLAVRGAPALGAAGALGVVLAVTEADRCGWDAARLEQAIARLRAARPTAVNLTGAVDRVAARMSQGADVVLREALAVLEEDVSANRALAANGADLLVG